MSDALFQIKTNDSLAQSVLKRASQAIPYLRRTAQVFSDGSVKAPASGGVVPVGPGSQYSGTINAGTGLQLAGNNYSFYTQGQFGFTATANSITLYWDGTNGSIPFTMKRVDGSSFSIVKGSLTISGLTADTIYGFLPYNRLTNQLNLSFSTGDAGTPRFAFSPAASDELKAQQNQNQNLASNEAVTESFIYYTTAASGTIAGEGSPGVLAPYSERRDAPDSI